jgi:hypothetical protein
VAACTPAVAPTPSGAPYSPSAGTAATSTGDASPPSGSSGVIAIDPSLLSILPDQVGGVALQPAPEAAAEIAADGSLKREVEALAVALAIASGSSAADDLAIVSVVRLTEGIFGDAFYRDWRDSYDKAACAPAAGVVGNAEATIDGRQVFITSCTNGGATYHVHYSDRILVAITSLGPSRLGEQIISNLKD